MHKVPEEVLPPHELLFLGYRGSIAHGTYVPDSDPKGIDDKDVIGVYRAPRDHYTGLEQVKETVERKKDEWDGVYYEVRHFIRLLLKSNPNVLSTLWLDSEMVLGSTPQWALLRSARESVASKSAYPAFQGYAYAQLKRMTRGVSHTRNRGFMGAKRKALVEQHGYDTKNAAHLVRLLTMGREFLESGNMFPDRTHIDAPTLIDIKQGVYSLEQIEEMAEELFREAKEALEGSPLPEEPDRERMNIVCRLIVEWGK